MTRLRSVAAAALAAAAAAGCGETDGLGRARVTGTVTARGEPVGDALVRLIPDGATRGPGGWARTAADGTFTLTDARGYAGGVVPGDYKVTVSRLVGPGGDPLPAGKTGDDVPGSRQSMPLKVVWAEETPLTCTVPPGGGTVAIDIPAELFVKKPSARGRRDEEPAERPGGS